MNPDPATQKDLDDLKQEKQTIEKNLQNSKEPDRFARLININTDI